MRNRVGLAAALAFACLAAGCSTVSYYMQAIGGQMELMRKARPIRELLADPSIDVELKRRLERVVQIRNFASAALHLPDNESYRRYADIRFVKRRVPSRNAAGPPPPLDGVRPRRGASRKPLNQ